MSIAKINGIPVYDAIIDDQECGMLRISLVDAPAVMSDFIAFESTRKVQMYAVADEEQRRVLGVVMRADFPIYRYDREMGEYYIVYKAETIAQMAEKYLLESRQNDVNLDHKEDRVVDGVQMVQCFIKDSSKGIVPTGFDEIADGSLFAEFHIVNDAVWDEVKNGTYKGFSLEGLFTLTPEHDQDDVREMVDRLDGKFSKLFKSTNMSKLQKFLKAMEAALVSVACGSTTTDKGVISWEGEGDLEAGMDVFVEDAEGNRTPLEDGDYKTDDGKVIKVENSKVVEIVDADAEVGDDAPEAETEVAAAEEDETEAPEAETPAEESGASIEERVEALEALVAQMAEWLGILVVDEHGNEVMSANLAAQMASVKASIEEVRNAPSAAPAHENFKKQQEEVKSGDKGLNTLSRIIRSRK